ncbi:hypothetical protein [Micromonospora okii]|uniref:hypothetical protein n=1 Tax=Micromonospora okii TaxID=1182970 RepID=UPI001E4F780B|nr:hypothetical protein [Micromonospora okii]
MRMPSRIVNPVLAVLLDGSGFTSLDEFAAAVNAFGKHEYGLHLSYDHVGVKRWLSGGTCRQPEVVAEVLSRAWGVEIPVAVIWPQSRFGAAPAAPHLVPCVAPRTLDELAAYIGSDMLTRRALLTDAIAFTVGEALTDPLLRWLTGPAGRLPDRSAPASQRLTMSTVVRIEAATAAFGAQDAAIGGGLSREAAVGQLKHAVDLLRVASYTESVGNRMLAAIAELAGMAGWMSHDVQMAGPAQRYFTLGLQAARESTDRRSTLLQVSLLADMARQMRDLGHPATGLQLVDAALALLPRGRHPAAAAMLWNLRARMLGPLGPSSITELKHAIGLAENLLADATPAVTTCWHTPDEPNSPETLPSLGRTRPSVTRISPHTQKNRPLPHSMPVRPVTPARPFSTRSASAQPDLLASTRTKQPPTATRRSTWPPRLPPPRVFSTGSAHC